MPILLQRTGHDRYLSRHSDNLREKVLLLIEYEQAEANPGLPMFVMYELQHSPDLFTNLVPMAPPLASLLHQQVREAVAQGEMRPIEPVQILLLITANV